MMERISNCPDRRLKNSSDSEVLNLVYIWWEEPIVHCGSLAGAMNKGR
jgi:hypothetical protein